MVKSIYFIESNEEDGTGYAIVAQSIGKAKVIAQNFDWLSYNEYINIKGRKIKQSAKNLKIGIIKNINGLILGVYSWIEEECSICNKIKTMQEENLNKNQNLICNECIEKQTNISEVNGEN